MRVTLAHDGTSVEIAGVASSETISPCQLNGRLALYRRLRDRSGGRYARFYEHTVKGLEHARHQITSSGEQRPFAADVANSAAAAHSGTCETETKP